MRLRYSPFNALVLREITHFRFLARLDPDVEKSTDATASTLSPAKPSVALLDHVAKVNSKHHRPPS